MGIKMAEPLPQEIAFHVSRMLSIVMLKLLRIVASKGRASKTNGRTYGIAAQDEAQDRRMMAAPCLCNHVQSSLPFPPKKNIMLKQITKSFLKAGRVQNFQ